MTLHLDHYNIFMITKKMSWPLFFFMEMKLFPLENIESLWMYKVQVVNNLNIKLETRIFGRLF